MRELQRTTVFGVGFDPVDEAGLATHVCAALDAGAGGWVVLPDLDAVVRAAHAPSARAGLAGADLVVASGTTMALASRLLGAGLPAPDGASMIWSLCAALRSAGRSVYLLGGAPEGKGLREGAHRAATVLAFACPGIQIAGHASPTLDAPAEAEELAAIGTEIVEARPDVVIVGLDTARQGRLVGRLRPVLPGTWFVGWARAIDIMVGGRRPARRLPAASRSAGLLARAAVHRIGAARAGRGAGPLAG